VKELKYAIEKVFSNSSKSKVNWKSIWKQHHLKVGNMRLTNDTQTMKDINLQSGMTLEFEIK
jgi:hypothetical protein